jgi:hypothetical protein
VPSPLFNFLFLVALIVPMVMYLVGMLILVISLVANHYRAAHGSHQVEALAH